MHARFTAIDKGLCRTGLVKFAHNKADLPANLLHHEQINKMCLECMFAASSRNKLFGSKLMDSFKLATLFPVAHPITFTLRHLETLAKILKFTSD